MLLQLSLFILLAGCCHSKMTSQTWLSHLPWQTRDNLLSLNQHLNVKQLTGKPEPIYRPDLGEVIAYWLIRYNHDNYAIISAGDHTGDYSVILQGQGASPVDSLQRQAVSANSTCVRYTLLTPSPDLNMACYTRAGARFTERPVDNVNVTALWEHLRNGPEKVDDNGNNNDDNRNSNLHRIPEDLLNINYYVITPSQPAAFPLLHMRDARILSLGMSNGSDVDVSAVCRLLSVCNEAGRVHEYRETQYGEVYVHLEPVKREGVKSLEHDVHFVVEGTDQDNKRVKKGFVVEPSHRWKRQTTSNTFYSIDQENLMPDYRQFTYGKCLVGCGPVAWAQIFGYYDRRAHAGTGSINSQALYRCGVDGTTGSNSCQAPRYLDAGMRGYIGKLSRILGTFCVFGQGATLNNDMDDVKQFFKDRQGGSADIVLHKHSFILTQLFGVYSDGYRNAALSYIRQKWPVIVGFRVSGIQHYAVMTQYRTRQVYKRTCLICGKKWVSEYDMYLHMGWGGGSTNTWRKAEMFMVAVAKY